MENESIKSTEMEKELFSIIKEWKKESKVKGVILVNHDCATNKALTICTSKPGSMIGKHGVTIKKYLEKIKMIDANIKQIRFVETNNWYIK